MRIVAALAFACMATLVIDTGLGPRNAQTVLKEVERVAKRPELYLVTSHFHPEHAGGGPMFCLTASTRCNWEAWMWCARRLRKQGKPA